LGKPFEKELSHIPETIEWSFSENLSDELKRMISRLSAHPLLIVGSGGSFSGAQFIAQVHEKVTGHIAKAMTPLELKFSHVNPSLYTVLFLSASGNNKDILNSFNIAIEREFLEIGVLCAKVNSKISKKAKNYPHIHIVEYPNPTGKDGFLAVNSLLSTCILVGKAYEVFNAERDIILSLKDIKTNKIKNDWNEILSRKTIIAIGADWAWPAVIDLESKFSETALGNILITDFRNFGHGRHNWFNIKGNESGIVVFETPILTKLSRKTLSFLPEKYPRKIIKASMDGPAGTIELFIKTFCLVQKAGELTEIDPGRPKIPEFGRKLYNISFYSTLSRKKIKNRDAWIQRKIRVTDYPQKILESHLNKFLDAISRKFFAGIVFDYDGTLCDPPNRLTQPVESIKDAMNELLSKGMLIGIATGRGKSVQSSLRRVIDEKFWGKVLIGNYNGAIISALSKDVKRPSNALHKSIDSAQKVLFKDQFIKRHSLVEVRPKQISITPKYNHYKQSIYKKIIELMIPFEHIKIVKSDHSFDILAPDVSKLNVVKEIEDHCQSEKADILIIGDQGQYGGNDFEMLELPSSISVDKVSTSLVTCWNLSPVGYRGAKATLSILNSMKVINGKMILDVNKLEKEK